VRLLVTSTARNGSSRRLRRLGRNIAVAACFAQNSDHAKLPDATGSLSDCGEPSIPSLPRGVSIFRLKVMQGLSAPVLSKKFDTKTHGPSKRHMRIMIS
jgi:hypothetical protein